ncbi:hypothetical protein M0657_009772 [Pyricularia oryzae]|uniref:Uncharacterized protein n=1 Tax=Pyricularia oryzae TaxID=318829 RepID=A0A4P7NPQ0_PYROR|nr:hypothetical protein M0657_009772 [Pyricularia oryzae]KAI7914660.1 hypothetical protein M9X92_008891 [Pyricularia oryzae]QBZ64331.1 hypothetical protein PoMZ_06026 [Pyricularia oryzae]
MLAQQPTSGVSVCMLRQETTARRKSRASSWARYREALGQLDVEAWQAALDPGKASVDKNVYLLKDM